MTATRTASKSAAAFRTISEVSEHLEVPQHVLRFWETKFAQVCPLKRGGGRRYYRPEDVALLRRIRELLYTEGYTIKGVQRLLREGLAKTGNGQGASATARPAATRPAAGHGEDPVGAHRSELEALLRELIELRDLLRSAGK
jgi:DNA-binding transcriptional MerR regulator